MKISILLHSLIISIILISVTTIQAAEDTRGIDVVIRNGEGKEVGGYKESHALIICVGDYNAGWPRLMGVKEDAILISSVLKEHGFNVVIVMDPDHRQLEEAFKKFIDEYGMDPENRLIFYFAGHGHTIEQSYGGMAGYIVPIDAPLPTENKEGFLKYAMNMNQIGVYARRIQAKHGLFIFDSCFSGSLFSTTRAMPRSISYMALRPVRQFITSGSANEVVPDRSTFREQFVAALHGEGDANKDGYVTGTELGVFLQDSIINYSGDTQHPQYGKIRDRNLDRGDFVFALNTNIPLPPEVVYGAGHFEDNIRQREESRIKWNSWQKGMSGGYFKANNYEAGDTVSSSKKARTWGQFLSRFAVDNPYSIKDEMMRNHAAGRLKYWKNFKKPGPALTYGRKPRVNLRRRYASISTKEAKSILEKYNIFDRKKNKYGDFKNECDSKVISGDSVVIDHATGLMWQQSGSKRIMSWSKAKKWVKQMRLNGYAGRRGWRLPTMEEAATLLESSKRNGLYIDPVFSQQQESMWTGDIKSGKYTWAVDLARGYLIDVNTSFRNHTGNSDCYVRPVCSLQ